MITAAGSSETPGTDTDNQTIAAHGAGGMEVGLEPQAKGKRGCGSADPRRGPRGAVTTDGWTHARGTQRWEEVSPQAPGDADAGLHPGPRTRLGDP